MRTLETRHERLTLRLGLDECWPWQGGTNGPPGKQYGAIREGGAGSRMLKAHRVAWEREHGPILGDLTVDHLCQNRLCQNPAHMEVVTLSENSRRGALVRWAGHERRGPVRDRRAYMAQWRVRRRGHADPVTPDLHRLVLQRDGGCVAAILDSGHECRDAMGWPHRWDELGRLTVDHVQDGYGRAGKRAKSDPAHLVAMCHAGNLYWAPTHRGDERDYLAKKNRR